MTGWFRNLFLAEIWERFSFYGMQAVLVLYASAPRADGGLGLSPGSAAALFGAYLGVSFLLALPGGWLADRVLGQQQALALGLGLIAAGNAALAAGGPAASIAGLLAVAAGFGLFKPNHQALISMLAGSTARREATVAAFYSGIQICGLLAPLIVGTLGERVSWRLAFGAVALVVGLGTVVTAAGRRTLGPVGAHRSRPLEPAETRALLRLVVPAAAVVAVLVAAALITGVFSARLALAAIGICLLIAPWVGYLRLRGALGDNPAARRRLPTMLGLIGAAAVFWLLIGQNSSVLTLFAKDSTDRTIGGFTVPASWLQAVTPLFMLLLAPVIAWQLPRLGARFGVPVKFAFGLLLAGISYLVMAAAAGQAASGPVTPWWLLAVYLLHAVAEIVIAAVSMSSIADLVPRVFLGQAIGVYWLFAALGGGFSGQIAALIDVVPPTAYYLALAVLALIVGAVLMSRRERMGAALGPPATTPEPTAAEPSRGGRPS